MGMISFDLNVSLSSHSSFRSPIWTYNYRNTNTVICR